MNTTDCTSEIRLDRRTLLRNLLLAAGGIVTNSLYAEALTLPPCQKNNQFPIDATSSDEATARFVAYMDSRWPELKAELEKLLLGKKMACIDDSFTEEQIAKADARPVRGHIYTIRAIRISLGEDNVRYVSLLLEEIVNTRLIFGREPAFKMTRFEPADLDDEQSDVQLANAPDARRLCAGVNSVRNYA